MKIYLVGGAVRDKLLNLPVTDRDWVVVGASPELLLKQGYKQVGNHFPVFLHPKTKEEYALARTEHKSGNGYTGFTFDFNPSITIEDDLIRRDLTINAIAQDEKEALIDPYNGVTDLKKKVLKHVSSAFSQDPLRVLRVARFAARFHSLGFQIATETMALMKKMVSTGEINYLTKERVWIETEKALKTADPQIYFSVLNNCGALPILFPEIAHLFHISLTGRKKVHRNYGEKMLSVLKLVALLTEDITCRFAIVCYLIGQDNALDKKPNVKGMRLIRQLCTRLKIPVRFRNVSLFIYQYCNQVHHIRTLPAKNILALFDGIDAWRHPLHIRQLIICSEADFKYTYNKQPFTQGHDLIKMYQATKDIKLSKIMADGYTGNAIREELNVRRLLTIEKIKYILSQQQQSY